MAIAYRNVLSTILPVLAAALYFLPGVPEQARVPAATACWFVLTIVGSERRGIEKRPPQPIWSERDAGQKFSIVMFHLMLLGFAGVVAWNMVEMSRGPNGAWWQLAAASVVMTAALWMIWRNWSTRNAR